MRSRGCPEIIHIEACDFVSAPIGGQLSFSKQLIGAFGTSLALVGWTSNQNDPIGIWFRKRIGSNTFDFFAFARAPQNGELRWFPARLATWFQIRKYGKAIFAKKILNVLVSDHSVLMAMPKVANLNVCYYFPGVASPLRISKYRWAKVFSGLFDVLFYKSLRSKAISVLAAADQKAITGLYSRANGRLDGVTVKSFPTRIDTNIFCAGDKHLARNILELAADALTIVTTGRVHWAKGWALLLDAFALFAEKFPNSNLIFVGDGPDLGALYEQANYMGISGRVVVTGMKTPVEVSCYLQAADCFVMGSIEEGWCTSLLEALAVGLPIVTTSFSSADVIVREGVNGFIVKRDPTAFASALESALNLGENVIRYSEVERQKYSLTTLANDITAVWPLRVCNSEVG